MNRTLYNKLIFELSHLGRKGHSLRESIDTKGAVEKVVPAGLLRDNAPELPMVDEPTTVRHYTNMSNNNFGVDTGFYPLGSCTMKYNPKVNEAVATSATISAMHPLQPAALSQGALLTYWLLQRALCEIGGMSEFTLNPYAGAHGELTGLMVIRAYHAEHGDSARTRVIVPDSAHGTNPASAAVAGLEVVEVRSKSDGTVDLDDLKSKLDYTVAAVMLTNPNTTGIFEREIPAIADAVHAAGALLYYDGANLNPMLGVARPGDMGFDVMHINLHKTFATPHGGGGPGAGPVGVRSGLEQYLPNPRVVRYDNGSFDVKCDNDASLGRISMWLGNYTVLRKALAYILTMGAEGLQQVGPLSTLAANYVMNSLSDLYELPIPGPCKHEFVFDGLRDKSSGVTTLNIAKRLLDYGFHAPTIYFPLLYHESLMIEPTETESKETLDMFIDVMRKIAFEAKVTPDQVREAPHNTPMSHPDETEAALHPTLTWKDLCEKQTT